LRRPLDPRDRTLIAMPAWLGDFVCAEPFVRAVHARRRELGTASLLSLAGPKRFLDLFDGMFPEARRLPYDRRPRARDWRGHDTAVLLTGSFRSAWIARRAGIPRRVGWSRDMRGWLLTDAPRPSRERGAVPVGLGLHGRGPRYLPRPFVASCADLGAYLNLETLARGAHLEVTDEALDAATGRLAVMGVRLDQPFLLINVGGRPDSAKAWLPRHWTRLLESLAIHFDLPLVLVCGPGEEEVLGEVLESARAQTLCPLIEPPVELPELAALASRAAVFITTDTGPRHVAAAVGASVACVFGPTDPRHTGHDTTRTECLRIEVPCGPCHKERCPLGGVEHHACMRLLEPEPVIAATRRLLT